MAFVEVARLFVDPKRARVYEHGWQSWSPTTAYPATSTSHRPVAAHSLTQNYRPGRPAPAEGFQGEGLLVVDSGDGRVVSFEAGSPVSVPSIRARLDGDVLIVSADDLVRSQGADDMASALTDFGDRFAATCGVEYIRQPPTAWCSWYQYYRRVTVDDVHRNVDAIGEADLPVDVIQIDDGWQSAVGDWLSPSERFGSLSRIAERIRESGRRPGIWVAPFLASATSELARRHPEWLYPDRAGHNWGGDTFGVNPDAAADHLATVFTMLRDAGFDYFKLDFLYAGALDSLTDYRSGLAAIRDVVGADAYLLGCGAPILGSVGLVDAMRVGPDIAPSYEPPGGDLSQPSQAGAILNTRGRAWQHGRFWVNDPDCLIARPGVERRAEWAATVEAFGGLRSISDGIDELDEWGLTTTRRLLADVPAPLPFDELLA
ncbi:glycoside hydrolase family 36 protein [Stackebrandtia soli]|uniref:glycoside hydrolase family 36 protein n=1 Tax=Stackebrandtia soli TaxID=1892856 RepID=UPI0039E86599